MTVISGSELSKEHTNRQVFIEQGEYVFEGLLKQRAGLFYVMVDLGADLFKFNVRADHKICLI